MRLHLLLVVLFATFAACEIAWSAVEQCIMKTRNVTSLVHILPLPPQHSPLNRDTELDLFPIKEHLLAYSRVLQQEILETKCAPQFLVFTCKEGMTCGGFGNRVIGATTTFVWALLTGRQVHFQWNLRISIADFFQSIDPELWKLDMPEVLPGHDLSVMNAFGKANFLRDWISEWTPYDTVHVHANTFWTDPYMQWHTNSYLTERIDTFFPYLHKLSNCHWLHIFTHFMMQPIPRLQARVEQVSTSIPQDAFKIGLQYRQGDFVFGLKRDWRQPVETTLCFADRAAEICRALANLRECFFFVSSDSLSSVDAITKRLLTQLPSLVPSQIVQTRGSPIHSDVTRESSWEVHLKTYLDWVLLTQMDTLLISGSTYGITAACQAQCWTQKHQEYVADCSWSRENITTFGNHRAVH